MKLKDLVEIIIPKQIKKIEEGESVSVLSQKAFASSGYTTGTSEYKNISDKSYLKYALKQYDIVLSKHGTPFKVAVIGKIDEPLLAMNTLFILRVKDNIENIEQMALYLYMYIKSFKGQEDLANISDIKQKTINSINRRDLLELEIPIFENSSQIIENFHKEQKLYNVIYEANVEINKLHQSFDNDDRNNDLGICKMCKINNATHLRVDTWQPFKRGIPMCDKCSSNIIF